MWCEGQGREARLKYPDYSFNPKKLESVQSEFAFLRAFVDYYYLLYKANVDALPVVAKLTDHKGWCVGDAHPENFGFLVSEKANPIFTMNDQDDSGPCPLALDIVRYLVAAQLAVPTIDAQALLKAYIHGLRKQQVPLPKTLQALEQKALAKGRAPGPKRVKDGQFILGPDVRRLDGEERATFLRELGILRDVVPDWDKQRFIDLVQVTGVGGGSLGLNRYGVLVRDPQNRLLELELKELVDPGVGVVTPSIPNQDERMRKTFLFVLAQAATVYHQPVKINSRWYLLRPRYWGNEDIELKSLPSEDLQKVLEYSAYTLGSIHVVSADKLESYKRAVTAMDQKSLLTEAQSVASALSQKFKELKGNL
jgi:hypothetical protein